MDALMSTAYLPPISFFRLAKKHKNILLEAHETYTKQTYRNRCKIMTGNGVLPLTIPVTKPQGNRTLTKDIRIDNSTKWAKEHMRAIESAYRTSPFFEFLTDYFTQFYEKEWEFLWDYNLNIIETVTDILDLDITVAETKNYQKHTSGMADYRNTINPKKTVETYERIELGHKYHQVFAHRFGFVPDLSIFDLLCNCGMESILYL
ncbi:MAG: WbqC family protein [Tenuifilaceae bacterium]|nr:WbqC family protein [Tenuifilaceae bacterium]